MDLDKVIQEIIDSTVDASIEGKISDLNNFLEPYGYSIEPLAVPTDIEWRDDSQVTQSAKNMFNTCLDKVLVETSSMIGMGFISHDIQSHQRQIMSIIYKTKKGGDLSMEDAINKIKFHIEKLKKRVPVTKGIPSPAGHKLAIQAHRVRLAIKGARLCVTDGIDLPVGTVAYLERLSELYLLIARDINIRLIGKETIWQPPES